MLIYFTPVTNFPVFHGPKLQDYPLVIQLMKIKEKDVTQCQLHLPNKYLMNSQLAKQIQDQIAINAIHNLMNTEFKPLLVLLSFKVIKGCFLFNSMYFLM